ncbi:MAG: methyltransferase domain-containing protein [Acidimicrobiales bacterium]
MRAMEVRRRLRPRPAPAGRHQATNGAAAGITVDQFARWAATAADTRGADVLDVASDANRHRHLFPAARYQYHPVETRSSRAYDRTAPRPAPAPLAVEDERFGVVLCMGVVDHHDHPRNLLSELNRVLDASGLLFLTTPLIVTGAGPDGACADRLGLNYLLEASGFGLRGLTALHAADGYAVVASKLRPVDRRGPPPARGA